MNIFDTANRKKISLSPRNGQQLTLYTCGPTVYDFAHIGNFRTYFVEDCFRRTWQYLGWKVMHVMNITDIDDKTIRGAKERSVSLADYTQIYKKAFLDDCQLLHLLPAHNYPQATQYIPQMIQFIETLMKKGFAYHSEDGNVYYRIRQFPTYGKLAHLQCQTLLEGASQRVQHDEYDKETASDFVLWKAYNPERDGDIYWSSPFGKGRPGWHIECSTMSMELLGETIDVHMGGVDNIFPHHENEIAQSEAYSGKLFVRYWIHVEHLLVNGKKMAKRDGNCYRLRDILEQGYSPFALRYLFLQTHYRTLLNFTFDSLNAAKQSIQRLSDFVERLQSWKNQKEEIREKDALPLEQWKKRFTDALCDDLNTPKALSVLFDVVRETHRAMDEHCLCQQQSQEIEALFMEWNAVLEILPPNDNSIPPAIMQLLEKRETARINKEWQMADHYRNQIEEEGYYLEDSPTGTQIKKK